MKSLLILFLVSTCFVLSFAKTPKHFFGADQCQYWKLKNKDTKLVEELFYVKTNSSNLVEHRYFTDGENLFSIIWDLDKQTRTQLKQKPDDQVLVTCEISNQFQNPLQDSWQTLVDNSEYLGKDGKNKNWKFTGNVGFNYEVEYTEKKGKPKVFTVENEDKETETTFKVEDFESECEVILKLIQKDQKICKKSLDSGNSVSRTTPTNSTRRWLKLAEEMHGPVSPLSEQDHHKRADCSAFDLYSGASMSWAYGVTHYGNHCGAGSDVKPHICCGEVCPDGGLDVLCYQHDSGSYEESFYGLFNTLPCYTGRTLIDSARAFTGCIGDENAIWRLDPDQTGAETCNKVRNSIANNFGCTPCTNYECSSKWDWWSWSWVTVCQWNTYYVTWPSQLTCDGSCYDQTLAPFDYQSNIC